jgi:hypothetical protein
MGAAACVGGAAASSASARTLDFDAISLVAHEAVMRLAIAAAKANPFYPFGAIIIGAADRGTLQRDGNRILTQPPPPAGVFFAIVNNIGGGQDGQVDTVGIIDLEASPPRVIDQVVASRGARVISLAACRLSEACVSQRLDA